jgi:hypothetical protein
MKGPMDEMPYLHVVDQPRMMRGEGAPRSTVFGVLGRTKERSMMRSLGGLVENSKASAPVPKGGNILQSRPREVTERHIVGPPSKTHIPGAHYSMVPYPGKFMAHVGERL